MKKLLLLALMATGMHAMAAESLKTPYGTLAIKQTDPNDPFSAQVVIDRKPVKEISNYGIMNIENKSYKIGKLDIYVISSESEGNGSISTQEKYYFLLVFEPDKKLKVVSHDEFWVNRFQDHEDAIFSVKENKLYGELGPHEDYTYTMVYDGKTIKVKKGKKIKKAKVAKGAYIIDKEMCQTFHEDRESFCDVVVSGHGSSIESSWIDELYKHPGADYPAIERLCKNKKAVRKMDYKTFESKICKSTK